MILSFSSKWPGGHPTNFFKMIRAGQKPQTIRKGERFKAGDKVHHWMGSPRQKGRGSYAFSLPFIKADFWYCDHDTIAEGVYSPDEMNALFPECDTVPHFVAVPLVYAVEHISIYHPRTGDKHVKIGSQELDEKELKRLIVTDGFAWGEAFTGVNAVDLFWSYFTPERASYFKGQIIHWQEGNLYNADEADIIDL
jgi:hypothetical protein